MGSNTVWSRRSALVAGASAMGAAVLAGPLGPAVAAAGRPAARTGTVQATTGLLRSHWSPLVGRTVTVTTRTGSVRAVVAEITDLAGAPAQDPKRFSVVLRTTLRQPAIAGLNPITIPGRGVATLLITAVDRGARQRLAQVVVNNPTP